LLIGDSFPIIADAPAKWALHSACEWQLDTPFVNIKVITGDGTLSKLQRPQAFP